MMRRNCSEKILKCLQTKAEKLPARQNGSFFLKKYLTQVKGIIKTLDLYTE